MEGKPDGKRRSVGWSVGRSGLAVSIGSIISSARLSGDGWGIIISWRQARVMITSACGGLAAKRQHALPVTKRTLCNPATTSYVLYCTARQRLTGYIRATTGKKKACSIERRELFSPNRRKPLTRVPGPYSRERPSPYPLPALLRHENTIITDKQSLIPQCSKPRVISSSATAPILPSASVSLVSDTSQLTMSSPSLPTPGTACRVNV